jgi:uncharacterized membrane protein YvlD (DUF360 family)
MILTLFSFGASWLILALAFFGLTHVLPGFHSVYFQTVLGVGLFIGLSDVVIARMATLLGFRPLNPVLYLIIGITDYILIQMTPDIAMGYYIPGHEGTLLAAVVLSCLAFVVEAGKVTVSEDAEQRG